MLLKNLTGAERENLENINKLRATKNKRPIQFDKMPKQEVLTHLYGWDNPNIDINEQLKNNVDFLKKIRGKRKNPNKK